MVPDFLLEIDEERGLKKDELAELKVICCSPSPYVMIPPHPHPTRECVKAVDKRAGVLTDEYRKKAKNVDRMYGWVAEGAVGRVQTTCTQGVVVCLFGVLHLAKQGIFRLRASVWVRPVLE